MAGIGPANTRSELIVRRGLHAMGWRYRLHGKDLAGKPDLVFRPRKALIFVNGCFWHGHDCHLFKWPGTRPEFWRDKISGNIARDRRVREQLAGDGWRIADVWECSLKGRLRLPVEQVMQELDTFLRSRQRYCSVGEKRTVAPEYTPLLPAKAV